MFVATSKRFVTRGSRALGQCRHGGSLTKNKHVENWNNWRGDAEKRFNFDKQFFGKMTAWGLVPFGLYYTLACSERSQRAQNQAARSA